MPMTDLQVKEHLFPLVQAEVKKLGQSQRAAAKFTGVSPSQIYAIQKGKTDQVSVKSLLEVAKAYGIPTPDWQPAEKPSMLEHTKEVTDTYVIHCIKNRDYDGHEITQEEINERRDLILQRREARKKETRDPASPLLRQQELKDSYREELTDHYVKGLLIRAKKYKGEVVTAEMLEEHRQQIMAKRLNRQVD